jgi:hypothetical protein
VIVLKRNFIKLADPSQGAKISDVGVSSVALSSDGRYAFAGNNNADIEVFNVETSRLVKTLHGSPYYKGASSSDMPVESMQVSPDGRFLLSNLGLRQRFGNYGKETKMENDIAIALAVKAAKRRLGRWQTVHRVAEAGENIANVSQDGRDYNFQSYFKKTTIVSELRSEPIGITFHTWIGRISMARPL